CGRLADAVGADRSATTPKPLRSARQLPSLSLYAQGEGRGEGTPLAQPGWVRQKDPGTARIAHPLPTPLPEHTGRGSYAGLPPRKISINLVISGGSGASSVMVSSVVGWTNAIWYACSACRSNLKSPST